MTRRDLAAMRPGSRRGRLSLAGFLAGGLAGAVALAANIVAAGAHASAQPGMEIERGLRDALHTPPLLVEHGRSVTLRYGVVCQSASLAEPCRLSGAVYVAPAGSADYARLPLEAAGGSTLAVALPGWATATSGFSYYAVVEDGAGERLTVPESGAAAPSRAWVLDDVVDVGLGRHAFGWTEEPDRVVASAAWGHGEEEVGLIAGREQAAIGPSAFDVAADGSVVLLDQVNHRLTIYGGTARPQHVPIPFEGGEGDVAVTSDAVAHVLDRGRDGRPRISSYTLSGARLSATVLAAGTVDMVRAAPAGLVVHGFPADMWFPVTLSGTVLSPIGQARGARAGRPVAGGGQEVVVSAGPREARFALVRGDRVLRAWRVAGDTPLGEVQLAQPFGDGLLVVVRVWTEDRAEFLALVLSPRGLDRSFALDAAEWAEAAALGRFRLDGTSLYQLRSSHEGVQVVSYDLGGAR